MNIETTGAARRRTLSIRYFMDERTTKSTTHHSAQLGPHELRRLVAEMID
jgi:hypothetical protein